MITDKAQIRDLTAFFAWTAWAAAAERPGHQLQLHQQLAGRVAGRQRSDRVGDRVVGAVADRVAGRHRDHVRGLRALEPEGRLAQRRGVHTVVPPARRGEPDTGAAGLRLVLRDRLGAVSGADAAGRGRRALPGRFVDVLRPGSGPGAAVQPGPDLASAAVAVLDRRRRFWRVASFWCRSSPAASRAVRASGLRAAGRGRGGGVRLADLRGALHLRGDSDRAGCSPSSGSISTCRGCGRSC